MKTFSEFLDEALASFIVKAAARQLFKSRALQKGLSKTLSQVPKQISKPPKITGFQTGRGSKYTYTQKPNSWPQTQRTAPNDPYHPTPAGTKQKSDYTMFTTPEASMTMRQRFVSGSEEPFYQGLPQSTKPKVGRAPVEVWRQYAEKGGRAAIHPGSPITDIQTATPGSGIGLYGAQRKELQQRVKVALQKPQNIDVLRREIGMTQSPTSYRNLGVGKRESVKEQKTFLEFITEARRMRVLRTAHYNNSSAVRDIHDTGFRQGTRSDGAYHDKGMNVVYTTPSSRVGADYGPKRVHFKLVNPKVTNIDSPKNYGKRIKDWMRDSSDDDLVNDRNRPKDSFNQSREAIRGGSKVIRVPDAHGGHDEPKKGNRGSYIILDKEVANKSIDRNPQPTIRSKDKKRRTQTQPKKKQ
jgi:hypothetical protein